MSEFDVIIVGGGIAGASLGAEIAAKCRTLVIEAEENCAYHTTGRSAAFWLAHYGGPKVVPLTMASRRLLLGGWPTLERPLMRQRGIVTIAREYRHLREALAANSQDAPVHEMDRRDLEERVPGLLPGWDFGVWDPSCGDIDVAGLHGGCLADFHRRGGALMCSAPLRSAKRVGSLWQIEAGEDTFTAPRIVNAAGAWADEVARRSDVSPLGITPYRRTIVQIRVTESGLKDLPLVNDGLERFYFKGESDNRVWVSPHDLTPSEPCDAAPEEIDVATAIDHFQSVVDWPLEAVERKWAGLRSFAPDWLPVYGFDPQAPGFFWCAGQGGFGIQTSPAAAKMAAALLLGHAPDAAVAHVDPAPYHPSRFS